MKSRENSSAFRIALSLSLILAVIGLSVLLFRARYHRTITVTNLTDGETQTVAVALLPHRMDWRASGEVEGSGFLVLSSVYSNRVSGRFSVSGGGDYYETNASAAFIPDGQASGKIRTSFRFNNGY
jgi:hypothetical protein